MKRRWPTILMCTMVILLLTACQCQHDWVAANCTTAKTCVRCKETVGQPLGHSWFEASCDKPLTCSICDATLGQPLGHTWSDASCESPATCLICGAKNGQALGHNWIPMVNLSGIEGAICTECQECQLPTDTWTPLTNCEKLSASNENAHLNDIVTGDWQTRAGRLPNALRFCVANKDSYKNTHYIIYNLDANYQYLSGLISISDKCEQHAEAKILIYLDNELAYESIDVSEASHDVSFTLDVEGVQNVRIVCSTAKKPSAYCVLSASVY